MRYSVDDIVRRVRVLLDYDRDSDALIALDDATALSIEGIIRSKIEEASRRVLLVSPAELIDTAKPIESGVSWRGEPGYGMGLLLLPDNFLRLISVQLSDWKRPAQIITESDPLYKWQSSPCAGVRGNPDRPVAAVVRYPEGMAVELYSSHGGAGVTLTRCLYVAEPKIDYDNMIDLPHLLLDAVVRVIGGLTCETLGDIERSNRLLPSTSQDKTQE